MHPVIEVLKAQKQGRKIGIYSCCSSNELVLKAALLTGKKTN
ncbi:MAG: class II D-tagatose-bisphosphate aldolase, non-catalytic subunit, partial [Erysipelotrichaceae bacterium]|nr:class II D-tagatose-bisphosphate aldolase, non-catalytic subunit [Erysipelotrichaceae bacterium]